MKQIRIMAAVFTVLMLAALGAGLLFLNSIRYQGRDISEYNDRIHRMYAGWAEGIPIADLEKEYGCDIILSGDLVDAELTKFI